MFVIRTKYIRQDKIELYYSIVTNNREPRIEPNSISLITEKTIHLFNRQRVVQLKVSLYSLSVLRLTRFSRMFGEAS